MDGGRTSRLEAGREGISLGGEEEGGIFSIERVDYNPESVIRHVQICNGTIALALDEGVVIIFRLDFPSDIDRVRVITREGDSVHGLFLDPTGNHLLVSLKSSFTYYLHTGWSRPRSPRLLLPLNGLLLSAVGWDPLAMDCSTTGEFLLCSTDSVVWRTRIDVRVAAPYSAEALYLKSVFQIQPPIPLTAVYWSRFSSAPNTIFVVLATATRLYQFAGEGSLEEVFLPYHESPVFREIPGLSSDFISTSSNLSVLSTADGMAQSLIWITAQGLFYGEMLPRPNSHQDAILTDTKLIPFPTQPLHSVIRELLPSELMFEIPADVHLTPFHFLVLWPSSFQALSPISLSLVDSQDFSTATGPQSTLKAGEIFKGFVHDRASHTLWIHSARSVFEIIVANEDRHIWELYLQKGMYAMALKFAQTPRQRQTILRSQSDHYLRRGDFVNAALLDAKTDQPFEEVALKFLHRNRAALKVYLGVRLEQLFVVSSATRGTESPKSMASQITMICTWMTELLLRKISRLQSKQRDTSPIAKELRDFLSKYAQHLDADTTLRLISSSGHTEELLFCSSLLGFHEQTVAHLCRQLPAPAQPGDTPEAAYARKTAPFVRALGIIDQHLSTKQHAEAVYRFAQPLFAQIPFECVSFWISKGPGVIDPKQLIPTIMGYVPQHNPPGETENQALRFLRACCSRAWNCREPSLHNYLFSLYARDKDEQPLLKFLSNLVDGSGSSSSSNDLTACLPCFDPDYALRLCLQHNKLKSAVMLYGRMGLYDEAVDLALRVGLEMAKVYADKPGSDLELRRKLWLKIVHHVIRYDESINKAVELMTACPQFISIEDIIQYLPDTSLIDDFKEEICRSLEDYNHRIEELRTQMRSSTLSSRNAREEIAMLRNNSGFVSQAQKCCLCDASALSRAFYLFPCRHAFHTDCFLQESVKRTSICIMGSSSSTFSSSPTSSSSPSSSAPPTPFLSSKPLSQDCILCGDSMIAMIDEPLFDKSELSCW